VDTGGDAVERYLYDPYGVVTFFDGSWSPQGASSYDNSILFCGYYRDKETGLYHVRRRVYHAQLGRWVQRDPGGYADGPNTYGYGRSSPTGANDPSGLAVVWSIGRGDPVDLISVMENPAYEPGRTTPVRFRQTLECKTVSEKRFECMCGQERDQPFFVATVRCTADWDVYLAVTAPEYVVDPARGRGWPLVAAVVTQRVREHEMQHVHLFEHWLTPKTFHGSGGSCLGPESAKWKATASAVAKAKEYQTSTEGHLEEENRALDNATSRFNVMVGQVVDQVNEFLDEMEGGH